MSVILQAPYPALEITTYLPNPKLGDSINRVNSLDYKRSMDGNRFSYVKSKDDRFSLLLTFVLSQNKALELREFYDEYNGDQIKLTNHDGKVYVGYITNNPFELEALRRAAQAPGLNTEHQVQIKFEGTEQST